MTSVQKSLVAILVGIAVDRGLLQLEDSVSHHLKPGWSHAAPMQEALISIRHLLSMTSGLTYTLSFKEPSGESWQYNTRAYSVLGDVLEAATGQNVNDLTRDWITDPLKMTDTGWYSRDWVRPDQDANRIGLRTSASDLI